MLSCGRVLRNRGVDELNRWKRVVSGRQGGEEVREGAEKKELISSGFAGLLQLRYASRMSKGGRKVSVKGGKSVEGGKRWREGPKEVKKKIGKESGRKVKMRGVKKEGEEEEKRLERRELGGRGREGSEPKSEKRVTSSPSASQASRTHSPSKRVSSRAAEVEVERSEGEPKSAKRVTSNPPASRASRTLSPSKRVSSPAAEVVSPVLPRRRDHVMRDVKRIETFKHKIRKVTGDGWASENLDCEPNSDQTTTHDKVKIEYNDAFKKLRIMHPLLRAIDLLGWSTPTPVQIGTIALGIRGMNIVASAETGTGKTAAYGLPLLQRIYIRKKYEEARGIERIAAPLGVVLCPTRELAEQVEEKLYELARFLPHFRILGLSGALKDPLVQIRELHKGVDLLVATPGRLLRLLNETPSQEDFLADKASEYPNVEEDKFDLEGNLEENLEENFEEIDEFDETVLNALGSERNSLYDDGFGTLPEDEEASLEASLDADSALQRLVASPSPANRASRRKRDAVYSQWDKAWEAMEKTQKGGQERFKERLPFLPHGQAVKNANIDLTHVRGLVLDEVDRMLAMGMLPEVRHLFKAMPRPQGRRDPERMQVSMFSATLVPKVTELVKRFAPHHIRLDLNRAMNVADRVQQFFYLVGPRRKYSLLAYLLRRRGSMKGQQVLVFCRTRQRVERLTQQLVDDGFNAQGIHGDQSLNHRQRIIDSFKEFQPSTESKDLKDLKDLKDSKDLKDLNDSKVSKVSKNSNDETSSPCQILVSTELMARGMDIPSLPFVVNYDLPHSPEEYVHRIGRTARAGQSGTAISFVSTEPTLLEVGKRLVELDEKQYLSSISSFLQKPLYTSKVPGPWRDEDRKGPCGEEDASSTASPKTLVSSNTSKSPSKAASKSPAKSPPSSTSLSTKTPILDVRTNEILNADQLKPHRPQLKYQYLENDAEIRSAIPPERDVLDKAKKVLTRLYDKKTKQLHSAASSKSRHVPHIDDASTALKSHVTLRDFKEGRYEDVMNEFDTKRARRLGIVVPTDLDRRLKNKQAEISTIHKKKLLKRSKRML